jgi:hypothetical protein
MGKKTPPYENWDKWTQARFWTFIRSALRNAWNKYPPKFEALKQAEIGRRINKNTGKLAKHYMCSECGEVFIAKDVVVHHKVDAGMLKTYEDLPLFVKNLFCNVNDLSVVCKPCHKKIHANKS